MKAEDVDIVITMYRYVLGLGAHESCEARTKAVSDVLRRMGIPHSPAQYDKAGDCLTCGECGRCPGVHTFEEIQEAARVVNYRGLPAFRVTYEDGESYITSMARGITLDVARAYFVGAVHTMPDEKTKKTVKSVEQVTP